VGVASPTLKQPIFMEMIMDQFFLTHQILFFIIFWMRRKLLDLIILGRSIIVIFFPKNSKQIQKKYKIWLTKRN
jgi:hypothetical protein